MTHGQCDIGQPSNNKLTAAQIQRPTPIEMCGITSPQAVSSQP